MNLLTTSNLLKAASCGLWTAYYAQESGAVKNSDSHLPPLMNEEALKAKDELAREFAMQGRVDLVNRQDVIKSSGSSLFSCFHKTITMDSRIAEIDADAMKWLMRREFCLLNSTLRTVMEGAACVSAVASSFLVPVPLNLGASFGSTWLINKFFRPIVKEEADNRAFATASKEELKGAQRLYRASFLATSEFNKKRRGIHRDFFFEDAFSEDMLKRVERALKVRFYFSEGALRESLSDHRVNDLKRHMKERLNFWEKSFNRRLSLKSVIS
jgi:hypothetical protein